MAQFALLVLLAVLTATALACDGQHDHSHECYEDFGQTCFGTCEGFGTDLETLEYNAYPTCANPSGLDHAHYMRYAISIAKAAHKFFSAVIVNRTSGAIVASGVNTGTNHIVWGHGEMVAIMNLTTRFPALNKPFSNLVLYTTGESCPMCMSTILYAGFSEVVYGSSIIDLIDFGWPQQNLPNSVLIGSQTRSASLPCIYPKVLANETEPLFNPPPFATIPPPTDAPGRDGDDHDHHGDGGDNGGDHGGNSDNSDNGDNAGDEF